MLSFIIIIIIRSILACDHVRPWRAPGSTEEKAFAPIEGPREAIKTSEALELPLDNSIPRGLLVAGSNTVKADEPKLSLAPCSYRDSGQGPCGLLGTNTKSWTFY